MHNALRGASMIFAEVGCGVWGVGGGGGGAMVRGGQNHMKDWRVLMQSSDSVITIVYCFTSHMHTFSGPKFSYTYLP